MVLQKTYISDALDEVDADKVRYDNSVKILLADPQILARILKYTVEEFADDDIGTIMAYMDAADGKDSIIQAALESGIDRQHEETDE